MYKTIWSTLAKFAKLAKFAQYSPNSPARVPNISEKCHFGECEYLPKVQKFQRVLALAKFARELLLLKFLPKSLRGVKGFRKNCQGGPPILVFLHFY